ncbi:MAG: hypothetical protein PHD48_07600 [Alphaproteobacteria bacterium]|nr:hypothetical protein [Alphaproteobacteria bacterium]
MKYCPHGFGGERTPPDEIKRNGWRQQGILVVSTSDSNLTRAEKEFLLSIGERLYGNHHNKSDAAHD